MPAKPESISIFCSKESPIRGRNNNAILRESRKFYKQWCKDCSGKNAKRRPSVKSKSLKNGKRQKRKIFIDRFQEHLKPKNNHDVARRMRLLPCVRDLLENTEEKPIKGGNDYQFTGKTPSGRLFKVIIKEAPNKLYFVTCYPARK